MLRPTYACELFLIDRRRALPMTDVDDDIFRADEFIFIIRRPEIERAGLFRAGRFQHAKLLLIVLG